MKNYITLDEAKNKGFEIREYDINKMNEEVNDLQAFESLCKLVPLVYVSTYEGKEYFEHITVFIEFEGVSLRPYKRYNEKNYIFFLAESLTVKDFAHNLDQPNKVGKPTAKKLREWVDYLQSIEALKKATQAKRDSKETEFLDKVKNCGLNIVWYSDGKSGYIQHKDHLYKFQVHSNGFIEEKLTYTGAQKIDNLKNL